MLSGLFTLNAAARCVTEALSTTCAVHIKDWRAGGCPAVVAQWQSTGGSSQRCPGFKSWRLSDYSLFHFPPFSPHNI